MKIKYKSKLLGVLGRLIIQFIFLLNKIDIKGEKYLIDIIKSQQPSMMCVWHGRLLFPSWYIRFHTTLHIISSRHPDSEILAHILKYWKYSLIKGSTNKGGISVIKKMKNIFNQSGMIAVTNDGPKGPPKIAKSGSISLALKNNVTIFSVTGSATRYWTMKSWDGFILPKPFGRIQIVVSPPFKIKKNIISSKEEVKIISKLINDVQDDADRLTGIIK